MSRRLASTAFAAVLCAFAFSATPASALPPGCDDPSEPGCEPVEWTDTGVRKLTVSRTQGTVASTPSGINCPAGSCSTQTSVSRDCVDSDCGAWPGPSSWTLTASAGPAGYVASWSDCGVQPSCTVALGDTDDGDVFHTTTLTWIDNAAPSVTFAPPANVGPSNYNLTAAGSDTSGTISKYAWTVDGVAQAATGAVLSLSAASNGSHSVGVRSFDGANNASGVVTKTVVVDKAVGVTPSALPAITNAATVPFTFAKDADVVTTVCSLDGGAYVACSSGWSGIGAATADGDHSYRVKVTDDVGNVAESAATATVIDRTLPVLAFTDGPTEGQQVVTRNASITFSLAEARISSVKCKLDAGAWAVCSPGTAVELIGLSDGPHVLSVQSVDTAGNTRTINRSFAVQIPSSGGDTGTGGGDTNTGGGTTAGGDTTTGGGSTTGGDAPSGGGTPQAPAFAPRFTHDYVYAGKVTTFTSLAISGLPKTAKVTVTCKGSGCAGKSKTIKHSGGKLNVLKALKQLKLKAGATLVVAVRGAGGAQSVAKYVIRKGRRPGVSYRCAAAGGKLGARA